MNDKFSQIFLSVVIPTYNEGERIKGSLSQIKEYLAIQNYSYEVIISDDGSTDLTRDITEDFASHWPQLKLLSNSHKGKAPAIISGSKISKGQYTLFSDIDLSVSIDQLPPFIEALKGKDFDIAIATREGTGAKRIGEPVSRHIMGRAFNFLVQTLALPGINDTQCGFKLFKSDVAKHIFSMTRLYSDNDPEIEGGRVGAFDVEFLYIAKKLGYKIKEVPVTWVYGENSKVHSLKDSYYNAKDVINVRLNSLKGLYSTIIK